ncbi:hypothetical protein GCM10009623_09880 [Nocardioides aestuarii]|uniref:DUF4439 domain-containing protein n=1 Tax=Nocardioides aestuarii TaxID=252231 RepID=A0ABW4TKI2_9ACTN
MDPLATTAPTRPRRTGGSLTVAAVVAVGLGLDAAPAAGAVDAPPTVSSASRTDLTRADAALDAATAQLAADHPRRARLALTRLRRNLSRTHASAESLIGKPPTDPESDDPPGPPAVLAALRLDHRVGTRLVPAYDGLQRPRVLRSLSESLTTTYSHRDATLATVIALPPEGAGDDYTDGMSDTLTQYSSEVSQLTTARSTYTLTDAGSAALATSLATVLATQEVVEAAYGGGE